MPSYNACLTEPLDIREGHLHLSDKPGLGYELDRDFIEAHLDTQWASLIFIGSANPLSSPSQRGRTSIYE